MINSIKFERALGILPKKGENAVFSAVQERMSMSTGTKSRERRRGKKGDSFSKPQKEIIHFPSHLPINRRSSLASGDIHI